MRLEAVDMVTKYAGASSRSRSQGCRRDSVRSYFSYQVMSSKGKESKKGSGGEVYQKFLDFLRSPMWVLPVMSFVEQRSVVFDKEQGDEQLYAKIHSEFRSMVDMLIQCFCDDTGIKAQQVADAIKKDEATGNSGQKANIEWSLLEPVIAANDYNLFVHMMMRKNIELQLQAVQMIEIMCGLIPAVLLPGGPPQDSEVTPMLKNVDEQEKIILLQVMRQSKEDYEKEKAKSEAKNKHLQDAIKESIAEKDRLMEAQKQQENLAQEVLKLSINERSEGQASANVDRSTASRKSVATIQPAPEQPLAKMRAMSIGATAETGPTKSKKQAKAVEEEKTNELVTDEAVRKRQEYLRQQRDKLLAMKREAREAAFAQAEADGKQTRPKTARAAKAALRGGLKGDLPPVSDDVLAARRALAEKLKQEVVGNV